MSVKSDTTKYDMERKPIRQRHILRPLTWLMSYPDVWKHRLKITRTGMEGLKPPFLLLCTHQAFMDFKVTTAALFPFRTNYVVAIDGFIGREWLMRQVGCICKRKFTNDIQLIRHIKRVLRENRDILALYPEARYSLAGTNAELPESLGKLIRMMDVPVVMLKMHGHYLNSPCWNLKERGSRIEAEISRLIDRDALETLTVEEINRILAEAFRYDEYAWQKENRIRIAYPERAKGLHNILYQCPHCLTEFRMDSAGHRIWCDACGKAWVMTEFGELEAESGVTEFSHVPDWYEFERTKVREQILSGEYSFSDEVAVDSLPNSKGYVRLGLAHLTHDRSGFRLEGNLQGKPFLLVKEPRSMYACHIEYDYFGKGDCLDLSTLEDTFYLFPRTARTVVTKISFATEELYKLSR